MKEWQSEIAHEFERCETRKKCSKFGVLADKKKVDGEGRSSARTRRRDGTGKLGENFEEGGNARLTAHIHTPHFQSPSPYIRSPSSLVFVLHHSQSFSLFPILVFSPLFLALCHSPLISTLFPFPLPDFFRHFSLSLHSFRKIDEFQPHSHKPQAQRQKLKKLKREGTFERSKREKEEIFEKGRERDIMS